MKVLVLNYEYPPLGGGAAPVSRDLAIALATKGHKVTVVTMGYQNLPDYEEPQDNLSIYRLKCLRGSKSSCNPIEQFSYLLSLQAFMKKHKELQNSDVCHSHFVIPTGEGARRVCKKYGIPYYITAHGSDVEGHNTKISMRIMHRFLRSGWRKIVRESQGVISPSQYLLDRMKSNYPLGKYFLIPNGIDYGTYEKLSHSNKQKTILIMGRLQKFKNVQSIIRALKEVEMSDWKVIILGDGPYRQDLERMVQELQLQDIIQFKGWIDNKSPEQLKIIGESSIYISASRFENCPMSVVEVVVAGNYPILSDIPAHRQLLSEDRFYFDVDNIDELRKKIRNIMDIVEAGNELMIPTMEKFGWERISKEYEKVLSK